MKKQTKYTVIVICVIVIIAFNVVSIRRASKKSESASPPVLNETSIVIYGVIEPLGESVSVTPKLSGIVRGIYVQEGYSVQSGQPLCTVESTSQNGDVRMFPVSAPQDGLVYKCDLRVGETFAVSDSDRLILGSPEFQICCDVEILWIGKIDKQSIYDVFNAENEEIIGTATFRSESRYLRPKSVRTEEPGEKTATQYQEVIMDFEPSKSYLPIGLPVMLRVKDEK